jgi:hypothetical protein
MPPKTPEVLDAWTGIARQTGEQLTARTQDYFVWVQNNLLPWGNADLNKKLMNYATEAVMAPCTFAQKLSQAKNFEDVVRIQSEFVKIQTDLFNERAKELGEMYSKVTTAATKAFDASR